MYKRQVEFPGIYYYDAVANYELKHADVAEKAVRRAIELDKDHAYPAAEALLGKVLADKGDSRGAMDHFTKYVQLAPKADDVLAIRQRKMCIRDRFNPSFSILKTADNRLYCPFMLRMRFTFVATSY